MRNRRDGGVWSALTEVQFSVGTQANADNLVISELMYHPAGDPAAEFVEVMNISETDPIDLTGVKFVTGIEFDFPANLILPAGQRYLIVRDFVAFSAIHGAGLPVIGILFPTTLYLLRVGFDFARAVTFNYTFIPHTRLHLTAYLNRLINCN